LVSHWVRYKTEEPFIPNLDKFGFVYLITNTQTTKAYVGYKQYYIGKAKKQSKWQTYVSSSKYVKDDIEKIGKEHFTFEAIAEYKNKRSLRYYEMYYQVKWNVLTSTIEGSNEPAFYNLHVGGNFYRPVESYTPLTEETKRKIGEKQMGKNNSFYGRKHSEESKKNISQTLKDIGHLPPLSYGDTNYNYRGKTEFYLNNKQMVVDCLGEWAVKNGYNRGSLNAIALTFKQGYYGKKNKKSFFCNGPLGTITKVKRLGKEETNVNQESNVRHSTS